MTGANNENATQVLFKAVCAIGSAIGMYSCYEGRGMKIPSLPPEEINSLDMPLSFRETSTCSPTKKHASRRIRPNNTEKSEREHV
jgi:hypothetical protein